MNEAVWISVGNGSGAPGDMGKNYGETLIFVKNLIKRMWKFLVRTLIKAGHWIKNQNERAIAIHDEVERSREHFYHNNPWAIRGLR